MKPKLVGMFPLKFLLVKLITSRVIFGFLFIKVAYVG